MSASKSAGDLRGAEAAAPDSQAWAGLLGSVLAGDLLPRTLGLRHRKASGMAALDASARGQLLIEACEVRAAARATSVNAARRHCLCLASRVQAHAFNSSLRCAAGLRWRAPS